MNGTRCVLELMTPLRRLRISYGKVQGPINGDNWSETPYKIILQRNQNPESI